MGRGGLFEFGVGMRVLSVVVLLFLTNSAFADLRITRDYGGYLEDYKAKYARLRDKNERVVIDGICNSACTIVFGIVPLSRICVTPRAKSGLSPRLFRPALDRRLEGDQRIGQRRADGLLPPCPEGLAHPQRRAGGADETSAATAPTCGTWSIRARKSFRSRTARGLATGRRMKKPKSGAKEGPGGDFSLSARSMRESRSSK